MFDKLVESEPAGQVRSRRNYFVVTTLVMSVMSLTAIVVSIFADDYSMNASIELSELISPVEMAQVAPEQPQPRQPMPRTQQSSTLPTRVVAMAPVDDTRLVPNAVSTTPNAHLAIPIGRFVISDTDSPRAGQGIDPAGPSRGAGGNTNGFGTSVAAAVSSDDNTPPPPVRKLETKKSGGVLNGKASSLPVPAYPATARAINAQGQVTVQVTVDESGNVISALAVSGHPLLRPAAEDAARRAKFTPTYLSGVPVKVTGVIIYNFNRG
jgi:protein TonB